MQRLRRAISRRPGRPSSAALGDDSCWLRLGLLFDLGHGVEVDKAQAMRCYQRAWRQRNAVAANNIAILYRERGNRRASFRWFNRAAAAGDGGAWLKLAKCYRDGIGVRKSVEATVRCLAAALASNDIFDDERAEAQELMNGFRPRVV